MSNGRCWCPDELSRLRRLVASGMTDAQIGEDMGRDRCVVGRKRRELRIGPGQSIKLRTVIARIRARERARCLS